MKNYSSKRAKKGKLAYRTPSRFIYKRVLKTIKEKCQKSEKFWKKISKRLK